jgi:hypothetical protein
VCGVSETNVLFTLGGQTIVGFSKSRMVTLNVHRAVFPVVSLTHADLRHSYLERRR